LDSGKNLTAARDWSVNEFDSMEIRLGKSAKFDGAGVRMQHCSISAKYGG